MGALRAILTGVFVGALVSAAPADDFAARLRKYDASKVGRREAGQKLGEKKSFEAYEDVQSTRLYNKPDPEATGGLMGRIAQAPSKVLAVLAIAEKFRDVKSATGTGGTAAKKNAANTDTSPRVFCYLAELADDNEFSLHGLPAGKYDLFVLCEDRFFEGLKLSREESALTEADQDSLRAKMKESNPFFELKQVHRVEGTTGRMGMARALQQEVRARTFLDQAGIARVGEQIRSIKLYLLDSVGGRSMGAQWDVRTSRELTRQGLKKPDTMGLIPGHFVRKLQGIRVSSSMKDVGEVELTVK